MTIDVFVHAVTATGSPLIADHYQFGIMPRVGEEIVITEDGREYLLSVVTVRHFPKDKDDSLVPTEYAHLECVPVR